MDQLNNNTSQEQMQWIQANHHDLTESRVTKLIVSSPSLSCQLAYTIHSRRMRKTLFKPSWQSSLQAYIYYLRNGANFNTESVLVLVFVIVNVMRNQLLRTLHSAIASLQYT